MSLGDWLAVAGLPLMVIGYVEAFTRWGPRMPNVRKPLGYTLLAIAIFAYGWDLADRFGAFGPTKAELSRTLEGLQKDSDRWRILAQGNDGHGGLKGQIAALRAPVSREEKERRSVLVEALRAEYFKVHPIESSTYGQVVAWINARLDERGEDFKVVANSLSIGDEKFPSSVSSASPDGDCPPGAAVCLSGNVPNAEVDCIRSNGPNAHALVVHSGPKNLKSYDIQTNSKQPCPH